MIHIVFNEADVIVLNAAIALDQALSGKVLQVKDEYAVGPVDGIYTTEGKERRSNGGVTYWPAEIMMERLMMAK